IALQWLVFLVLSAGTFAALRPLAHRLDRDYPSEGIGANHLIAAQGPLLTPIGRHNADLGMVRIERQEWPAASLDGQAIRPGPRTDPAPPPPPAATRPPQPGPARFITTPATAARRPRRGAPPALASLPRCTRSGPAGPTGASHGLSPTPPLA